MTDDFKIIKLSKGRLGIHSKKNGIGFIVIPNKKETREELLEWVKKEIRKELEKRTIKINKVIIKKECPYCGKVFTPKVGSQKYCKRECTNKFNFREAMQRRREKNEKKLSLL